MKFAQIGYGHDGRGDGQDGVGYTYVVNDNVRVGQQIGIAVTHAKSKKIFGTTGKVLDAKKNINALMTNENKFGEGVGDKLKDNLEKMANEKGDGLKVARTAQGMGVSTGRQQDQATGRFVQNTQNIQAERRHNVELANAGATMTPQQVNEENATARYGKKHQTFEEYSKPFMGEGENGQ